MIERIESSVRCRGRWPRKPPNCRHGGGEPLLRLAARVAGWWRVYVVEAPRPGLTAFS